MRISLVAISGAFALGMLAGVPARAQGIAPSVAVHVSESDTKERIAAARAAERSGRFQEAFSLWTQLAEDGAPEAQMELGRSYHYGSGTLCRDDTKAVEWYSKAADHGVVEANRRIGEIYAWKDGPVYDLGKAAIWYQKGADLGDRKSQAEVAYYLSEGKGVLKDLAKSLYWLEKAASHPDGIWEAFLLGDAYNHGRGLPKDDDKAIYWYLRAASGGEMHAQASLASIYERRGNYVEAYKWYAVLVVLEGKNGASTDEVFQADVRARDRTAARLTRAQLAEVTKWISQSNIKPFLLFPDEKPDTRVPYCGSGASPQG